MSSDTTNTTPGTPEAQRTGDPPEGSATDLTQKTRAAARYGQMTDEEQERINVQFDGRVRDEAYAQAWCEAVDALWESAERPAFPTEQSATATGTPSGGPAAAPDGAPSLESLFGAFLNGQSEETLRRIADAFNALLSRAGSPQGASSAAASAKSTSGDAAGSAAKDETLDLKPIYDAIVAYVVECISDGSARKYVSGVVGETISDAVRSVLDERGFAEESEVEPPGLYESVVEFARAAQSPSERLMWARFARQLEQDGRPGFVERMLTGWMRDKAVRVEVASHAVCGLAERAYEFYLHRREEASRREADLRHTELHESGKSLSLILGSFRDIMDMALGHIHGARGAASESTTTAQAAAGKPPAPPASGSGGNPSFS